jgi:hypothetical protein
MEKNPISFAEDLTRLCVEVMRDWASLDIPFDVMAEAIGASDHLMEDLFSHYNSYSTSLDTFTRDDLFDAIAKKFTTLGRWPLNMDGEEISNAFYTELVAKIREVGGDVIGAATEGTRTSHGGKVL